MEILKYFMIGAKSWVGKLIAGLIGMALWGGMSYIGLPSTVAAVLSFVMVLIGLYIKGFVLNFFWKWDGKKPNRFIVGLKSLLGDVITGLVVLGLAVAYTVVGVGLLAVGGTVIFAVVSIIALIIAIPLALTIEGKVLNFFWKWK